MRQVWITRSGRPDVLEVRDAPDPSPGPGEVRIAVRYAGINFADILARLGLYPDAPKLPCVMGYEVSGVIDAVGENIDESVIGQRRFALTRFGGYSSHVVVLAEGALPTPDGVSDEAAAAFPVTYLTAHHMLVRLGNLQPGETVLVHAAAGGVGLAAIQLCAHIGARVIGTASTPKHEYLKGLGVEPVDYRRSDWPARVRELTGGRGVDIALDAVAGRSFRNSYDLLALGGRLFCFGVSTMSGSERRNILRVLRTLLTLPRFKPLSLMTKNRGVFGVNLGGLWREGHIMQPQLEALSKLLAAGAIAPVVDRTFSFEEAAEAHRYLQARKNIGKVLLAP